MRMPFFFFFTGGDLKFVILIIIFLSLAAFYFSKKLKARQSGDNTQIVHYNHKINSSAFWILILSILSLLLGFMHSFYFMGRAGSIAPGLTFQGVANALITPVLGIGLFLFCKILSSIYNPNTV